MSYEQEENQNTERASEDIGNVADGIFKANAWDSTLWVDSHRGGCCIGRGADKKRRCMVLKLFLWVNGWDTRRIKNGGKNLAIKDIAPWVRGSVSTKGLKVAETGHLCSLDCSVAESNRVDKTRLDTSSVVGGGRSRRGGEMAEDNNGATLLVSDTCEAKNRHMALEIIQPLSVS